MFNPYVHVEAAGEVIPGVVSVSKLDPAQPAVARFAVECSCGETTIVHVPVAQALVSQEGSYQCGCGFTHRFALTITANGANE